MSCYDFRNLDPIDFENLTNDLLSRLFNIHIERFKPGKDLGIDGRFFISKDKECVIQSKHYAESGLRRLVMDLKNKEKSKIDNISPDRYILSTSVPLSLKNKNVIKNSLSPYIQCTSDIFGKDDLNALISQFPEVEKSHYKLWIHSSEVLRTLLNAATYSLSEQVIRDAIESSNSYVVTNSHDQALEKILETNTLVVTGEPGVGKTTLAEQVCLHFVTEGYELVAIENDIQDARSVFNNNKKQIFYFDDFLGRNFLETLRFNEDTQIMKFVKLVQNSGNKKFVLTSRTNILDQGYSLGQFNTPTQLKSREYILQIKDYTYKEKARILYSFMWKSGLSQEYMEHIIINKKYIDIVNHKNYNPRILEFITSYDNCVNIPAESYVEFIDTALDNPVDVWDHPYTVQLDDFSRALVDLVVLGNSNVEENSLKSAYKNFVETNIPLLRSPSPIDFDNVSRTLSRTFINRNESHYGHGDSCKSFVRYTPFNPSIADYVLNKYKNNPLYLSEMLLHFDGCDGLTILDRIFSVNKHLSNVVSGLIADKLGDELFSKGFEYIARIGCLLSDEKFIDIYNGMELENITYNVKMLRPDSIIIKFCNRYISSFECTSSETAKLFCTLFERTNLFYYLEEASELIALYSWSESQLAKLKLSFHKKSIQLWSEDIASDFISDNVEKWSEFYEDYYSNDDYGYEIDVDVNSLSTLISESTDHLLVPISEEEAFDIISEFDLDDIAQNFYTNNAQELIPGRSKSEDFGIDGLFEGFIDSKFSS